MTSKPAFPLRGVMLDLGRITERREYYEGLLPRLAEWGYNLVHLHLIDDQRCALRFPSRP
jgi:N-acetyl-beta-hexosaminidase